MKKTVFAAFMMLVSACCMAADREIPADRKVEIKGVQRIETQSSVTVHFTQGSASTVLVKENGADRSVVRVKGNTLYIETPALTNYDGKSSRSVGGKMIVVGGRGYDVRTDVTLTLPCLSEVENSGSLTFKAEGPINTARGKLRLSNSGSMRVTLADVSGTEGSALDIVNHGSLQLSGGRMHTHLFGIDNSGSLTADFGSVTADGTLKLDNAGVLRLTLPEARASELAYRNYGSSYLKDMTLRAASVTYDNTGSDKVESCIRMFTQRCKVNNSGVMRNSLEVRAEGSSGAAVLEFENYGSVTSSVKFAGERASIKSSGSGEVSAEVRCNALTLRSDGTCRLKASGKAGNLDMGGISRIYFDVSGLDCREVKEDFPEYDMQQRRSNIQQGRSDSRRGNSQGNQLMP